VWTDGKGHKPDMSLLWMQLCRGGPCAVPPSLQARSTRGVYTHTVRAVDSARGGGASALGHACAGASSRPLTWYSCGPTVYDSAHLGHARTYVTLDLLRRITEAHACRPLSYAMGITDIDDKILARAAERGVHPAALTSRYEGEFWEDMSALGVPPPSVVLRVTEHLDAIVDYIARLVGTGAAYVAEGHGVYMDVGALGGAYGELGPESARRPAPLCGGGEAAGSEGGEAAAPGVKRDARDFALWKVRGGAVADGSTWPSPWGAGRPGWHIECSAMIHAWTGPQLDVHAGGVDLAFPHHCNEIAQATAHAAPALGSSSPQRWVGTWLHTGHIHIAGRKMSKSLKNFITVREMLVAGAPSGSAVGIADAFRMYCASHGYRASLMYAPERLEDAAMAASRLDENLSAAVALLGATRRGAGTVGGRWATADAAYAAALASSSTAADEALTTDFDTPAALRALSNLASTTVTYASQAGTRSQPGLLAAGCRAVAARLSLLGFGFAAAYVPAIDALSTGRGRSSTPGAGGALKEPGTAVAALVAVRGTVRAAAADLQRTRKMDVPPPAREVLADATGRLLAVCDAVRDVHVPAEGWKLSDSPAGPVLVPLKRG